MFEANSAGPALRELNRLRVKNYVNAVAWNSDGSRLAGLSDFGHTITVWETAHWTTIAEFNRYSGGYSFNSIAYLPDGTLLTSAPVGKSPDPNYRTLGIFSLIQWNPDEGRPIRYIPNPVPNVGFRIGNTDSFVVSPDGLLVAGIMNGSDAGDVLVFETNSWTLVHHFVSPPTSHHPDIAWSLAFSPNGQELVIGTISGFVHVFGLSDGSVRLSFLAYANDVPCNAIAFSLDGSTLATGRGQVSLGAPDDGRTRLWHASDGKHIASLQGGHGNVYKIAWGPGGLLAAGYESSLEVWPASSTPPIPLLNSAQNTFCVAFAPDGTLAATHSTAVTLYRIAS